MYRDDLADIAIGVFGNEDGLLVTLSGYFDESYRSEHEQPLFVAGYLFGPEAYKRFVRRWKREVLCHKARTTTHFHATDLYAGRREYEGLSIKQRVAIFHTAVDVIRATYLGGIGVHFNQVEFEKVAPESWPNYLGSIYSAACQMTLQATGFWLDERGRTDRVLYVFERGHKFRHEADCLLRTVQEDPALRKKLHYRNHVFEEKKDTFGLQAADLLAWTLARARVSHKTDKNIAPFVPQILRLAQDSDDNYKILSFTDERLERLVAQQWTAERPPTSLASVGPRKRSFR